MAADCGGALQTLETYDLNFVTNRGMGTGLISNAGRSMTCMTPSYTTTVEEVHSWLWYYYYGNQTPQLASLPLTDPIMPVPERPPVALASVGDTSARPYANHDNEIMPIVSGKFPDLDLGYTVSESVAGSNWSYQFYHYYINVEAKMDMTYRLVGGRNHLIVIIHDIHSYLVGPDQDINYNFYAGLYMGGNISYALAVSLSPFPPAYESPAWKKCLGGWYSGAAIDPCSMGSCPPGESHIPPGGGTNYLWGRNFAYGSKFERSGNTPSRMDGPLEWDLGEITDYEHTWVGVYGIFMLGGDNNCNGARPNGNPMVSGLAYKPPRIKVCPPELDHIEQDRDICHNCAITDFYFKPNDLLEIDTGTLVIEYFYNAPADINAIDWTKAEVAQFTIEKHKDIHVVLPCLDSGTHYCWRAKIVVQSGSFIGESEYTYGCFDTLYIPEKTWVVPDISTEECELISRGGFVPQYEERPTV